jgi:hypothetical protein
MESREQEFKVASTRKSHNDDLIRRYRNGESLCAVDGKATWFPPRPLIEKDPEAIKRLYGDSQGEKRAPRRGLVLELGNHRTSDLIPVEAGDDK